MRTKNYRPLTALICTIAMLAAFPARSQSLDLNAEVTLDIPSQPLESALLVLSKQATIQLIISSGSIPTRNALPLSGKMPIKEALDRLLRDTDLSYKWIGEHTVTLTRRANSPPARATNVGASGTSQLTFAKTDAPAGGAITAGQKPADEEAGIPEILVKGSRILNMDIPRTRDDVLPFVVFDRKRIEQSGATNIEDFLKRRLTMNTRQSINSQSSTLAGARSEINLRGLGANQTLILIDGRRTSNTVFAGSLLMQQDLNGIPLSAVERIEVLPTTASGIYGGEATGGVVNIILRRDYQGSEVKVGWDSAFDTDDSKRKVEVSSGFNLEGGKTNMMFNASWSDGNALLRRDRDFVREYREQAFASSPLLWNPSAATAAGMAVPAPPLGYTTNIRSNMTVGGALQPLVLDNGTPLNSTFTFVPVGYAGAASDGGTGLIANAGRYNFELANYTMSDIAAGGLGLINSPTVWSVNFLLRRHFGERIQTFLELGSADNVGHFRNNSLSGTYSLPGTAINNPFREGIQVRVPIMAEGVENVVRSTDRRLVGGVVGKLPGGWTGEVDGVWIRANHFAIVEGLPRIDLSSTLNTEIQTNPTFNPIRDTNVYALDHSPYMTESINGPFETTTKDISVLLGGPVGRMPGGKLGVSVRLEHRDESFAEARQETRVGGTSFTAYPSRSQSVTSAYAEIRVPIIGAKNSLPLVRELETQLSGRWDEYAVKGSTTRISSTSTEPVARVQRKVQSTNPTVGLRWKPIEDVAIRASFGTGFLPPNVGQLVPEPSGRLAGGFDFDPRRGGSPVGTDVSVALLRGGNPDLVPEESESWSAGMIVTPRGVPGLRVSVDFVSIEKVREIGTHPQGTQGLINDEALFPGRVVRDTNPATFGVYGVGPIVFVDSTSMNIALRKVKAYDVQLDYGWEAGRWGTFEFFALATWQPDNQSQTKVGEPIVDNVGFNSGVLEYKANVGVTWNRRNWTLGWLSNYYDSYLPYTATELPSSNSPTSGIANKILIQGSSRIPNQIYHDAFATYRFSQNSVGSASGLRALGSRMLDRTELTLGIRNVFNTKPPRDQQTYSTYGDPRLASYWVSLKRNFD